MLCNIVAQQEGPMMIRLRHLASNHFPAHNLYVNVRNHILSEMKDFGIIALECFTGACGSP